MFANQEYILLKSARKAAYKVIKYIWACLEGRTRELSEELSRLWNKIMPCPLDHAPLFDKETIAATHKCENILSNKMRRVLRKLKRERINSKIEEIISKVDKDGHNAYRLIKDLNNPKITYLIRDNHEKIINNHQNSSHT